MWMDIFRSLGLGLLLSCICCLSVLLQASGAGAAALTPHVNTTSGPIVGKNETLPTGKSVLKYLGIPYAKAKRFENPTDPDQWNMTRNATEFGKHCPQASMNRSSPLQMLPYVSEDCLFINVFVPASKLQNPSSDLAVMVWIHGGGYVVFGGGMYDGNVLATEEGVIVVTFNYRLGALGFLSTGSDSDLKGNYGMLDQVQALKWVKNNIRSFGGDPNNVTMFGESAGGMSVSLLMLSPLTKGLYRNAILQSGAAPSLFTALLDNEPIERAKKFADALGCSELPDLKNCAMKKNISEIITAQLKVNTKFLLPHFAPVIDGNFLKDSPLKLLRKGGLNPTQGSVMIGVTRDEGTFGLMEVPGVQDAIPGIDQGLNYSVFLERINSTTWVRGQNEQILKAIIQEYTNWANINDVQATRQRLIDVFGDAEFKAPAILSAQIYDNNNMRTYFYQMEYSTNVDESGKTIPEFRRVYHGADVQYVFGQPLLNKTKLMNENDTDVKFSKTVMRYWATFAKTGNPTPSSSQNVVQWPRYTSANQQYLSLKPTPETKSNLLAARMNFWNSFLGTLKTEEKKPCPKDLSQELKEKEHIILGLAIALGVIVLVLILIIIFLVVTSMKTRSVDITSRKST